MNREQMMGNWNEFKGKLREKYGELTDDEVEEAKGNEEQLAGLIQQKYGKTKDEARKALNDL